MQSLVLPFILSVVFTVMLSVERSISTRSLALFPIVTTRRGRPASISHCRTELHANAAARFAAVVRELHC
jgi:hypothetical protein